MNYVRIKTNPIIDDKELYKHQNCTKKNLNIL